MRHCLELNSWFLSLSQTLYHEAISPLLRPSVFINNWNTAAHESPGHVNLVFLASMIILDFYLDSILLLPQLTNGSFPTLMISVLYFLLIPTPQ